LSDKRIYFVLKESKKPFFAILVLKEEVNSCLAKAIQMKM